MGYPLGSGLKPTTAEEEEVMEILRQYETALKADMSDSEGQYFWLEKAREELAKVICKVKRGRK